MFFEPPRHRGYIQLLTAPHSHRPTAPTLPLPYPCPYSQAKYGHGFLVLTAHSPVCYTLLLTGEILAWFLHRPCKNRAS